MTDPANPVAPVEPVTPPVVTPPEPPKTVSYESHQKLLDEKKRVAARLKELEDEKKAREEKELTERGEYQKLLAQRDEELNKIKTDLESVRRNETERMKLAAVLNSVQGDIDRKFFNFIDLSDIVVDPETGRPDDMSVAKAVEKLKATYPEFIKPVNAPRLPADAPQGNSMGRITESEWKALGLKKDAESSKKYDSIKYDQIDWGK